jgi:site-specific recombinase XerD
LEIELSDPRVTEIVTRAAGGQLVHTARDYEMPDTALERIRESVPESTQLAYGGDMRRYREWCADEGRTPVPATGQTLAAYVDHLANQGRAPSTIGRALAAIGKAHSVADLPTPDRRYLERVLARYRQQWAEQGKSVRKAPAVSIDALRAMVDTLDPETIAGIRDRAVIVVGFSLGARRSEIAALDLVDVTPQDEGVQIIIRRSKTDKHAQGRIVALPYGSNVATCPVRSLRDWVGVLAARDRTTGPLFLRINRHGHLGHSGVRGSEDGRITGQAVSIIIRRVAERAGLDAGQAFSGHSLRRGFATAAYEASGDVLRIARHGGWKDGSPTLLGYIEEVDRWKKNPLIGIGL